MKEYRHVFIILLLLSVLLSGSILTPGQVMSDTIAQNASSRGLPRDIMVLTTLDAGQGSLREAIQRANNQPGPDTIRFDSRRGPFSLPQRIIFARPLPKLTGELLIDGYINGQLWKASGITLSGGRNQRVLSVAKGAKVSISSLSIVDGQAKIGGGVLNQGELVVTGVSFINNAADEQGGALANLGGKVTVINSTFINNRAGVAGGGLVDHGAGLTVTNCTFTENMAPTGGGLFSSGTLLLRNSIIANSIGGSDCALEGRINSKDSRRNIIEINAGCGTPFSSADPRLAKLGYYNGPTATIPLRGGSPAINWGDNAAALDEHGMPLRWDQRGNGDPRYAAGITDIGAFEQQAIVQFVVDTLDDRDLRECTRARANCSLRGAITLAKARGKAEVIYFDPKLFSQPRVINLHRPLPNITTELMLDASKTAGVIIQSSGATWKNQQAVRIRNVRFDKD